MSTADVFSSFARSHILGALEHEIEAARQPQVFVVASATRIGAVWEVGLDSTAGSLRGLDEAMEGCAAWWATGEGSENGQADVLAAVPERAALVLRYCSTRPPDAGGKLFVYPPLFLGALHDAWLSPEWSERSLKWGKAATSKGSEGWQLRPKGLDWLRKHQREAFDLPGRHAGFLWGPPGTGKTTTLGAVLASLLTQNPKARVLLTSTTNSAVDIALVSVDKVLEDLGREQPSALEARDRCKRIGTHFIARNYENRKHLLPVVSDDLVRRMVQLEVSRPDPSDVLAYSDWKSEVEDVRRRMRQEAADAVSRPGLVAMTTTRAAFMLEDLRESEPFDLVVFDEASQIPLPYVMCLAPLGLSAIVAGDPMQLSPIVQSTHPTAKEWLGASGFHLMDPEDDTVCFLDEQSRMAGPISDVVSRVFYDGRLRVADLEGRSAQWTKARDASPEKNLESRRVDADAKWSARYGGPIRYESSEAIADLVAEKIAYEDEENIVILTPFRAQRTLIKLALKSSRIKVQVSTVHRAQGSERDIVIFDCVDAASQFLDRDEGKRLINVALSRAKRQLFVFWSRGDRANPTMDRIIRVAETVGWNGKYRQIVEFGRRNDFPACMIGHTVKIGGAICDITAIENGGARFVGTEIATGLKKVFMTDYVRQRFCS